MERLHSSTSTAFHARQANGRTPYTLHAPSTRSAQGFGGRSRGVHILPCVTSSSAATRRRTSASSSGVRCSRSQAASRSTVGAVVPTGRLQHVLHPFLHASRPG